MRRRSKIEIQMLMLELAHSGCGVTNLYFGARVSFPKVKRYIKDLEERGLLRIEVKEKKRKKIVTTTKGDTALEMWNEFNRFIEA